MIRLLLVAMLLGSTADAQSIEGRARAVDGDTLELSGQRIRLFAIDAPELNQNCEYRGKIVACGRQAAEALAWAVNNRTVRCAAESRDIYGRLVGICRVGQGPEAVDLAEWLVLNGAAIAETRFSDRYLAAQAQAQARRSGIWAARFEIPSEWRRKNR